MRSSTFRSSSLSLYVAAVLTAGISMATKADPAIPDPCKLITVAEIQQIVGKLESAPKPSDPASGEITCTYTPVKGPSFIDVSLHDGDLSAWKMKQGGKNLVSLPEFGKDAFVNPGSQDYADLFAKKGNLILQVSLPTGPTAVATAKAIAAKALARM